MVAATEMPPTGIVRKIDAVMDTIMSNPISTPIRHEGKNRNKKKCVFYSEIQWKSSDQFCIYFAATSKEGRKD